MRAGRSRRQKLRSIVALDATILLDTTNDPCMFSPASCWQAFTYPRVVTYAKFRLNRRAVVAELKVLLFWDSNGELTIQDLVPGNHELQKSIDRFAGAGRWHPVCERAGDTS